MPLPKCCELCLQSPQEAGDASSFGTTYRRNRLRPDVHPHFGAARCRRTDKSDRGSADGEPPLHATSEVADEAGHGPCRCPSAPSFHLGRHGDRPRPNPHSLRSPLPPPPPPSPPP